MVGCWQQRLSIDLVNYLVKFKSEAQFILPVNAKRVFTTQLLRVFFLCE